MRTRTRITAAILLLGTLGCVSDPVTGRSKFSLVDWSAEEELEMGREFAPNIEAQFDAVHPDVETNEALRELVQEMVALSPRRDDFDFHFKVLNSSTPNALALPGGYVYITRGLLQNLETEAQFISVMGHELGHVEHRHAMLNESQSSVLSLPTRPLGAIARNLPVGRRAASLAVGLVAAPSALLGLKFSRDQELEADERGVYFSSEMGYDPHDATLTFELFQRLEEASSGSTEFAIFRTHPMNEDRIETIEATIERDYPALAEGSDVSFRKNSPGFEAALARLRKEAPAYALYDQALAQLSNPELEDFQPLIELLQQARGIHPGEPLFHVAEGELSFFSKDFKAAIERFGEAIELYREKAPGDGHWKPHLYLGVFQLKAGDGAAAVFQLSRSAELFPMNGEIQFFLAQAHELAGDTTAAVAAYRRTMELLPSGSEAHETARRRVRELDR